MSIKNINTLVAANQVPIINLSEIDIYGTYDENILMNLALQLRKAMSEVGLALIINHGIPEKKIQDAWKSFDTFFELPSEYKNKYIRLPNSNWGYVKPGKEILDKKKRTELRYSFDICEFIKEKMPSEVPNFYEILCDLSKDYGYLSNLLLKCIALALEMPIDFFIENHKNMFNDKNFTTLSLLYYPPISKNIENVNNFIRCGAHRDYGTFTLLTQESEGGLEIKTPGNEKWQRVGYLPGSILINCGEILALWTKNRYPALNHRVIVPIEIEIRNRARHSIAFFVVPENETLICPNDIPYPGNKLEQVEEKNCTAQEHLEKRIKETYV